MSDLAQQLFQKRRKKTTNTIRQLWNQCEDEMWKDSTWKLQGERKDICWKDSYVTVVWNPLKTALYIW